MILEMSLSSLKQLVNKLKPLKDYSCLKFKVLSSTKVVKTLAMNLEIKRQKLNLVYNAILLVTKDCSTQI
jgi:hypothetical protein